MWGLAADGAQHLAERAVDGVGGVPVVAGGGDRRSLAGDSNGYADTPAIPWERFTDGTGTDWIRPVRIG